MFRGILLCLIPIALLVLQIFRGFPLAAADLEWSRYNIPAGGVSGKWLLAPGSDISVLTRASDGTLYCCANPAGTSYRLFKSTDCGRSWAYTGRVEDLVIDIAISASNPEVIFYASSSSVFRSSDAGVTFEKVLNNPGGAGQNGIEISCLDVTTSSGTEIIAVGTLDQDISEPGGILLFAYPFTAVREDSVPCALDVYDVVFSPSFATDRQIIAVASDEEDTILTTSISNSGWGTDIADVRIEGVVPQSASLALPPDYAFDCLIEAPPVYIGLDSGRGKGDVFQLKTGQSSGFELVDLNCGQASGIENTDISSLVVCKAGNETLILAGTAETAQVYYSPDSGCSWATAVKPPTGTGNILVCMTPGAMTAGVFYAASSGAESAFSISRDYGLTWNQTGLIDSNITEIVDLDISYNAGRHSIILITRDVRTSLWRSEDDGAWERILSAALPEVGRFNRILLSPDYLHDRTMLVAGKNESQPYLWKSTDGGQNFSKTASIPVESWVAAPGGTIFAAAIVEEKSQVFRMDLETLSCLDSGQTGTNSICSLAVSPNYSEDSTVLAGSFSGDVFISTDNGMVFHRLPFDSSEPAFSGSVKVAFDPDYQSNQIIYAAGNAEDEGISRFTVDSGPMWEKLDAPLPAGSRVNGLVVSEKGVLYSVFTHKEGAWPERSGLARCLDPAGAVSFFELITNGVEQGVSLHGLWTNSNRLWTAVEINAGLLTYTDPLDTGPQLDSPADHSTGLEKTDLCLTWQPQQGADGYKWQVDTDPNFIVIPSGLEGYTDSCVAFLPTLDKDIQYFWRVRADSPVVSPWSAIYSFDTVIKIAAPKLSKPTSSTKCPVNPGFEWTVTEGATAYELEVALNDGFNNLVVDKKGENACLTNAWICDVTLEYSRSYYWRVRASNGDEFSDWSATGIFTIQNKPSTGSSGSSGAKKTQSPTATPASSPTPSPVSTAVSPLTSAPLSTPASTYAASPSSAMASPSASTPPPPDSSPTHNLQDSIPSASTFSPAIESTESSDPSTTFPASIVALSTVYPDQDSNMDLIIGLSAGLGVLLVILIFLIIFILKRFRRY